MKAIIPVAGTGARLRPHTYSQPKALLPLAGKTVLDFTVEQLMSAGIREFIFIIGYLGGRIQEHVKEKYPGLVCHFVYQDKREGTGHAIILAREIVADDELIIVMGDTITDFDMRELTKSDESMIAVKRVDDPRGFGVAQVMPDGYISHLEEKPDIPMSNTALIGVYRIKETNILFECLDTLFSANIKTHGQYHLTDALQCMISKGVKMKAFGVARWYDCGRKESLLETNALLLKRQQGGVYENVSTENAIIIPPVSIGKNCVISESIIGPNVSIGEDTVITESIVRDSIIGAYSKLEDMVVYSSLIGNDVSLKGSGKSLNVGDNTAIDFNK